MSYLYDSLVAETLTIDDRSCYKPLLLTMAKTKRAGELYDAIQAKKAKDNGK